MAIIGNIPYFQTNPSGHQQQRSARAAGVLASGKPCSSGFYHVLPLCGVEYATEENTKKTPGTPERDTKTDLLDGQFQATHLILGSFRVRLPNSMVQKIAAPSMAALFALGIPTSCHTSSPAYRTPSFASGRSSVGLAGRRTSQGACRRRRRGRQRWKSPSCPLESQAVRSP